MCVIAHSFLRYQLRRHIKDATIWIAYPSYVSDEMLAVSDAHDWARFVSPQAYYTIAARSMSRELVPLLKDQGVGLLVWSSLAGGLLAGKFTREDKDPSGR